MTWDDVIKAIATLGAGLGATVFGYQKFTVARKKDATEVAGEDAKTAQYKLLQDSINSNKQELIELRAAFTLMDKKIHVQQRTITRMEMLLRQFSGLVSQHGIAVPRYMQDELEALIESDVERFPTIDPAHIP